jgi:hypothetical protein
MFHTTEIDMATSVDFSNIEAVLTNAAWAIRSTYHTVLNASQVQQFLVRTCCLTSPSLLTGIKLENIGRAKQTKTWHRKIAHIVIGAIKLVIK